LPLISIRIHPFTVPMLSLLAPLLFGMTPTIVPAPDSARTPVVEVPYDSAAGWIYVPATVNGHAVTLFLDHGTDRTLFSRGGLTKAGLVAGGADSIMIGTSVLPDVPIQTFNFPRSDGILGAAELAQYDFVFDGPARTVRLYAIPADPSPANAAPANAAPADAARTAWLPPGITPDNCTPMLHDDPRFPHRVFFNLEANGTPVHSMFDSGARYVNMNVAAAKVLGLRKSSPNLQAIDGRALGFCLVRGCATYQATHVPLSVGRQHIPIANTPVHIFSHLPREASPTSPELSMGLYAVTDRVFVVSYSTGQVCLGNPQRK
jgi:hypothetical protein